MLIRYRQNPLLSLCRFIQAKSISCLCLWGSLTTLREPALREESLFKKRAPFGCNLHITQFTHCIWFKGFQYSHRYRQSPPQSVWECLTILKRNLRPFSSHSCLSSLTVLNNHQSTSCLYGVPYLGYFIYMESWNLYLVFCGWLLSFSLFSKFTQVVACVRTFCALTISHWV